MPLLTFIYSHDDIFGSVKQESSLHSIRQTDKDGNPMFETLVFDEAYLIKFRELFFNAQAQIIPTISAYQKDIPVDPYYFERKDFTKDRDFICYLNMPNDFMMSMARPIEDYIFNFLKDWIMYKWLETKMPNIASVFLANCIGVDGSGGYKSDIKGALEKRTQPIRRWHGYW